MRTPSPSSPARRTRPAHRRPATGAALSLAVALAMSAAACSGHPGADATGTVDPYHLAASRAAASSRPTDQSTAPVSTPSPSLSPDDDALRRAALAAPAPARPPAMSSNTPEGAIATAQYFASLYPYAYATGDLTDWNTLSEQTCTFCTSVATNVTNLHHTGGWADPWAQTAEVLNYGAWDQDPNVIVVKIKTTSAPNTVHGSDGAVTASRGETTESTVKLQLHWNDSSWQVQEGETE